LIVQELSVADDARYTDTQLFQHDVSCFVDFATNTNWVRGLDGGDSRARWQLRDVPRPIAIECFTADPPPQGQNVCLRHSRCLVAPLAFSCLRICHPIVFHNKPHIQHTFLDSIPALPELLIIASIPAVLY
jgi:hypothetical protein